MTVDSNEIRKIIAVVSGKGGVGKTTISTNMAIAIKNKGFSTCIIDGNFYFGDVNVALDLKPSFTVVDIVRDNSNLDNLKIGIYLDNHSSGVNVLAAPIKAEEADEINGYMVNAITKKVVNEHNYVIVDLPSGFSDNNLNFMELSDEIILITDTTLASLKNTKSMIRVLKMLNLKDKISVIINKYDTSNTINVTELGYMLDINTIYYIPENYRLVNKSFNIGVPLLISKPKNKISKVIQKVAEDIVNEE